MEWMIVVQEIEDRIPGRLKPCNAQILLAEIDGLQRVVRLCLDSRFVFPVAEYCHRYWPKRPLFGKRVDDAIPSAREDLKEAGKCIAFELHTAAVFHLMRVVEFGLRELARTMKVKIPETPLDYAGWKSVVGGIETKLQAKIPKARGPKQAKALQFKNDLMADFKAFELRRNEIMHCRWRCNPREAMGLFDRVDEFMRRVALRIQE